MQQIIQQTCPSRQLFEKNHFFFYENFWFFSQNSHFWSISFSIERFTSRVTAAIEHWFRAVTRDANLSIQREMLQKWLFWLKNQKFSLKQKWFYEKLSTRASWFHDLMHFKQFHFFKRNLQKILPIKFWFFCLKPLIIS